MNFENVERAGLAALEICASRPAIKANGALKRVRPQNAIGRRRRRRRDQEGRKKEEKERVSFREEASGI